MQVPNTPSEMRPETTDKIHELVRFGHDAVETISEAGDRVKGTPLKAAFMELRSDISRNTRALEVLLSASGNEVSDKDGTAAGSLWTFWTQLRGVINAGDGAAMLAEVCRATARLEAEYREVLIKTAGSPVNDVMQAQHRAIKTRLDDLNRLRENWS